MDRDLFRTVKQGTRNQARLLYHRLVCRLPHLLAVTLLLVVAPPLVSTLSIAALWSEARANAAVLVAACAGCVAAAYAYAVSRPRPVYLVDMAGYKPGPAHEATRAQAIRQFGLAGGFDDESMSFQKRMMERSGLGEATHFPASLMSIPVDMCLQTARDESEAVVFGVVDELLAKTGVRAQDIGVVIANSSLYSPTPSFVSLIVNRYRLRHDIVSHNLSGMGCSAGIIAIDLAKHLLQVHPDTYALVVSTENITLNAYLGNNRPMLVTNTLFRVGGAAVLLSNRRRERARAKYQLIHTVRTHRGASDRSYGCVTQEEDEAGHVGVSLSKELMSVAGEALRTNITTLGPLVLPLSEQLRFLATVVLKRVFRADVKPHIPDFTLALDHFCIHAGGRGVLDELERSLKLSAWHMEPSRMTLYRFGNTSSSSLWYELAYCEAKGRIKKGDRVWQIAFGSGFKCNSAVWKALRPVDAVAVGDSGSPWAQDVDVLPVHVPKVVPIDDDEASYKTAA
ncbi:3-ketoacyl-CoA synthase 11-like [Hordeum vulgare]|uniref:3-ketoacyl-CoA synthase n=1 Tax=Hordeum vulgare subsp. vulgare TaxID=112509 RepID=F2D1P2_HORVV|nr:probable 3-ketoacyl-CoA synthase 20 [Hordeum vulgare subsp. vulgare]KAE8807615.1 3-ketoacyl-CoA synthase 11-like [Hordeum vulgare]BAJ89013.1 predicted protein [Hordeum vulgare subsp. vulgare]